MVPLVDAGRRRCFVSGLGRPCLWYFSSSKSDQSVSSGFGVACIVGGGVSVAGEGRFCVTLSVQFELESPS